MLNNYNSTLQSNNIDLQTILNTINELPDAESLKPNLQDKGVTPTTSVQVVKPDDAYDGLNSVTVYAIPTVTQATPTISIDNAGKITATATQTAGYVVAGTTTGTKQLTTQAAKTITPSTSSQTAVAKNVYTTGAVTVAAIPSTYVKPTTTKAATTYTPTTSNQTIAAGTYCSGAQTIKGDANLKAENIASGVSVFGVTGTHSGVEDLDSVITELETKVASLNTTLDNKAAGGGSIETCTVTIVNDTEPSWSNPEAKMLIIATVIDSNGMIAPCSYENMTYGETTTIPNVVCDAALVIQPIHGGTIYYTVSGLIECVQNYYYNNESNHIMTFKPSGDGTITIIS